MDKFLTKENIIIIVLVFYALIQSNYFATKLDVANIRNEMLNTKVEMQQYSDKRDDEILKQLDVKYEKIIAKLEKLR